MVFLPVSEREVYSLYLGLTVLPVPQVIIQQDLGTFSLHLFIHPLYCFNFLLVNSFLFVINTYLFPSHVLSLSLSFFFLSNLTKKLVSEDVLYMPLSLCKLTFTLKFIALFFLFTNIHLAILASPQKSY